MCRGEEKISRSGLTQDTKMGNMYRSTSTNTTTTGRPRICILRQGIGGISCPMSGALHIGQGTTAIDRHHCNMTSDVKAMLNPNKQQ